MKKAMHPNPRRRRLKRVRQNPGSKRPHLTAPLMRSLFHLTRPSVSFFKTSQVPITLPPLLISLYSAAAGLPGKEIAEKALKRGLLFHATDVERRLYAAISKHVTTRGPIPTPSASHSVLGEASWFVRVGPSFWAIRPGLARLPFPGQDRITATQEAKGKKKGVREAALEEMVKGMQGAAVEAGHEAEVGHEDEAEEPEAEPEAAVEADAEDEQAGNEA